MKSLTQVVTQRSSRIYSSALDSFFARCLPDAGCMALTRSAAFLRSRYALRRLRLPRTRCCCPTQCLSIETSRNAIQVQRFLPPPVEIAIAFTNHWLLKRTPMANREWVFSTATQRTVSGLTIVFLVLAAFFGFLNIQKVKALRTNATNAQVARDAAERRHAQQALNAQTGDTAGAEQQSKVAEAENRAAKAEADLAQVQKEKADLQAKLDANQQEIAALQKAAVEASKNANPPVAGSSL